MAHTYRLVKELRIDCCENKKNWQTKKYIRLSHNYSSWIVFFKQLFFNTFPQSEGWFVNYIELIMAGKMPYRDFYYYLPPLNLLIDYAFWKLSFGFLIIFRVWYLIERTSIYIFVYKILNMRYDWIRSSIACSISAILCTCDVFDLFGDYNQHIVVLTVALVKT